MKNNIRFICILLIILMLAGCAPKEVSSFVPSQQTDLPEDAPPGQQEPAKTEPEKEETPIYLSPKFCLASAEIPERHPYPGEDDFANFEDFDAAYDLWAQDNFARNKNIESVQNATLDFSHRVTNALLKAESGENAACSPANLYMALSMLAEVTDGESRAQVLKLLGQEDTTALRTTADKLWETMYNDDGASTCIPANALFLRDEKLYEEQTVDTVAKSYHADLFHGKMGTKEYDKILQEWLNHRTRGLLEKQARSVETNPETIMVLASALYFSNKWEATFDARDNFSAPFYGSKGESKATYMKRSTTGAYYNGEDFDAVAKNFEMGGSMWLIRPREGVSLSDILSDKEYLQVIKREDESRIGYPLVHLSLPKFDISATTDLKKELPSLGISDVFDRNAADFSPLTREPSFLNSARHDVRVMIDEEGCKAAAFTVMVADGATAVKPSEIEFTLDHPFIFLIEYHGVILFAGVVQNV